LGTVLNDKDCKSAARIIKGVVKVIKKNRRLRSKRKASLSRMHDYKTAFETMYTKSKEWTDGYLGVGGVDETGDFDKDLKTLTSRINAVNKDLKRRNEEMKIEMANLRKQRVELQQREKCDNRKMVAIGHILNHAGDLPESKIEKIKGVLQEEHFSIAKIIDFLKD